MRVWLAGSRSFGGAVLRELEVLPGVEIVGVTCPPGDRMEETGRLACTGCCSECMAVARIDLIVSAHNYQHISTEARRTATHGAIGYHPSLLPRHRGPDSVYWTVACADPIAGGTVYQMDDGWDTGPLVAQEFCHVVPGTSASELWCQELFPLGLRLLRRVVSDLAHGRPLITRAQDERVATFEPAHQRSPVAG